MTVRILSFHAGYACRHAGACCSAGWIDPLPGGICRHFTGAPDGGCAIHRASGHAVLPHACQQFPRVATLSPLGTSVTLSAYCPTAASLLFEPGPFEIVEIDDARTYEGMDARDVMPPLLREDMLMDWDGVAAWERFAVRTLSNHREAVETAIAIIEEVSETVCREWTPSESLASALANASVPGAGRSLAPPHPAGAEDMAARASALARYTASHLFANWPMYEGRGIRGAIDHLRVVTETLRRYQELPLKEAFRSSDLELRHAVGR